MTNRWFPASWLREGNWGMVPALTVVVGVGALLQGFAQAMARLDIGGAEILYWISFPLASVPITLALLRQRAARRERVALVILLGLAAAFAGLARAPVAFTGYDSLQHLRTANGILDSGHLFGPNPLLIVSPFYPGLEIVTDAIAAVSGVDVFSSWMVLLSGVRVIFALALFLLFEQASQSSRVAGVAAAVYMMNPGFVYFHSAFAYESLALPLVPVLLLLTAHRARPGPPGWHLLLAGSIAIVAATIVVTHHVTSYALLGMLLVWFVVHWWIRRTDQYDGSIASVAMIMTLGVLGWLVGVATATLGYLIPPLDAAVRQVVRLIATGEGRRLFETASGGLAPFWERATGILSTGIVFAWLPVGLGATWARLRSSSLALLLAVLALGLPASVVLRLTPTGAEAASRSTAFIWLGLAFVVAYGICSVPDVIGWASRWLRLQTPITRGIERVAGIGGVWQSVAAVGFGILTLGGLILGTSPATRLPGPYLVSADSRSIDEISMSAAEWAGTELGAGNRIAADRVNRLLMATYGKQFPAFHHSLGLESWQLFVGPEVGVNEERRIRALELDYLVVDRRLSQSLPALVPFYFEEGEIADGRHEVPIAARVLAKWDGVPGVDRVYDNGSIRVYDVRRISDAD
jgi:hypothetical protein